MQCPDPPQRRLRRPPHRGHRRQARHLDPQRLATDLLVCIDDLECLEGLQLLQEGHRRPAARGVQPSRDAAAWVDFFGVSGVCNVLARHPDGARTTASARRGRGHLATDGFDRYPSVLRRLDAEQRPMDRRRRPRRRLEIFRSPGTGWLLEGTPTVRRRWHNQKYFTWVEQQGKTVAELRAQEDPACWVAEQERAARHRPPHPRAARVSLPGCVHGARLRALRARVRPRPRRPLPGLRSRGRARDRVRPAPGAADADAAGAALATALRLALRGAAARAPGARRPPLAPGWTPILDTPRLAEWTGVRQLLVKDEGRNPTASFKDRASAVGVARALSRRREVVACASTGNAATSLAGAAASVGLPCVIFVPESAPEPKLAQLLVFGARVRARAGQLRRHLGALPARLRAPRLVQPQRRREPVAGRGQEDRRPRDRGAVRRRRCPTGSWSPSATAARSRASARGWSR